MQTLKTSALRIWLLSTIALVCACNKTFLDKAPRDSVNSANFWKTDKDAIAGINGCYQVLQWPKLYGFRLWTSDIWAGNALTGGGGGDDGIETVQISNFTIFPDNAAALDVWRGPGPGILRCNLVLEKVPSINMDEGLKSRILGEARFLRALYYFNWVRVFGDVPLITSPLYYGDDLRPRRAPKALVYAQIKQDLNLAAEALPLTYPNAEHGRATKGAALGLLAKVHLTLAEYPEVLTAINQMSGYSLCPDYSDNFNHSKEINPEVVCNVEYYGRTNADFFGNDNQANWMSTFMGPRNANFVGGGYGWVQPTPEFVNSYEPGDLRKDKTILYQGCPPFDRLIYRSSYSATGYNVRKFLVTKAVSPDYNTNSNNFAILRWADVLLMKAEALNALGNSAAAEEPLNQVRRRAGLPDVRGLSGNEMREKIIRERRIELAFEGDRWFDLQRLDGGQYGVDFLRSIGKTNVTSPAQLLLPIPQKEIDANPNLTQNPGY